MRSGLLLGLALLSAGCAGIEGDIWRAETREFFRDFTRGRDRGSTYYAWRIRQSTTDPRGGRYRYVPPEHVSHFLVEHSVRGLGGTDVTDHEDLLRVADWLLYALAYDPTASTRSLACEQLGRVLLRLPEGRTPFPTDAAADQRINQIAQDLRNYAQAVRAGEKVSVDQVVERMRALGAEVLPTQQIAQQAVRAFAIPPVTGARPGGRVFATAAELAPLLVRDAILVTLRVVACGDAQRLHFPPDPSPFVRLTAAEVLARSGSPIARDDAIRRLAGSFDPPEKEPDVRAALVDYLGAVAGRRAFVACVERLEDTHLGVRYHAQAALVRMTGARVEPDSAAWEAWLARNPTWGLEADDAAAPSGEAVDGDVSGEG